MKSTKISKLIELCKEHNNIDTLEVNQLYSLPEMYTLTPDSKKVRVKGLIRKTGKELLVKFESGLEVKCIDAHLFMTPDLTTTIYANSLKPGIAIARANGVEIVKEVISTDNIIDAYDISIDSPEMLYVDAYGLIHHNTGKTQTVEDTLHELGLSDNRDYFKVTGSASPAAVYEALYNYRDKVVLFDDCDGALDSQDGRNLIKAATDTKDIRKVSWMKKGGRFYDPQKIEDPEELESLEEQGYLPRYFEFTGKVIFISNLPLKKLDPDGALRTRGMIIELNPTNMEIYEFMNVIYDKVKLSGGNTLSIEARKEVVEKLKDIIKNAPEYTVNLRLLVRALNLAATGIPNWERMLRYI